MRPWRYFVDAGLQARIEPVAKADVAAKRILIGSGQAISYEMLVVTTGSQIGPDAVDDRSGEAGETRRLTSSSWKAQPRLPKDLARSRGGRCWSTSTKYRSE